MKQYKLGTLRGQGKSMSRNGITGEDAIQKAICEILDICGIDYYSVPNGFPKTPFLRWLAQVTGLKAGVPDLHLPSPVDGYNSVYIEVKKKGGRLDKEQKQWHERLKRMGHAVFVVWSLREAWELIHNTYDVTNSMRDQIKIHRLQNIKLWQESV